MSEVYLVFHTQPWGEAHEVIEVCASLDLAKGIAQTWVNKSEDFNSVLEWDDNPTGISWAWLDEYGHDAMMIEKRRIIEGELVQCEGAKRE